MFIDADGIIVDVNDTMVSWVGSPRQELAGRHFSELIELRLPPANDQFTPGDAIIRTASGNTLPVALGRVSVEANGNTQLAAFDVSPASGFERPFAVASTGSDRGKQRLQILYNASIGFGDVRTEAAAAQLLAEAARKAFSASAVSVHLVTGGILALTAGHNPLAEFWPDGDHATGQRTLGAGEVLVVPTPESAERYAPGTGMPDVFRAAGIHSALAAPIRAEGIGLGAFVCYFEQPRVFDDEAVPLAEALANQTAQAIQRTRLEASTRRAALHDALTGLPTRRLIEEQVAEVLSEGAARLAVLFIDLDGFKKVNDTLGHSAGDLLLMQVGQRLRSVTRDGELIGRFGGDEFIVVARVLDDTQAADIAERLRGAFDSPFAGLPPDLRITASIGVTLTKPDEEAVLDRWVREADQSMYAAKIAGGNQISQAVIE
ncbi:MAG: diguanylate cyclase [Microbacterium pygmaeum]